ncbi:hypothetical protein C9374_001025 [Naegleria lovaniensis]|uniref:Uncharacterized protein n=1 Tax=Naegleria lovaniensis TaxID=51637 RepID=A0AA88GSP8_NAELO|nr:uncharacterized protein C9374_001025 [Naegleria lovaniensis]KAG2388175.1 hypothetical protein C9374_001025 [Naegleria lovaniensis]
MSPPATSLNDEDNTNEDLFPSITSPTSKIKSLKSLKAIHKEISSILNPKFEQCRFLCPATQIISETRHRVVILSLIYHRQNRGEYAVFIFNENLKLRECIPMKSFNFFIQLQQPQLLTTSGTKRNYLTTLEDQEMMKKFFEKSWNDDNDDDDEYQDDYTELNVRDFKDESWKTHKFLATSTRLVLYQVVNEQAQDFVFAFQNDQQLMTCLMTLSGICSELDVENEHVEFDQVFELPYDLEYAMFKDEVYDENKSNIYKPPNGYQFFTSLSNIKDQMKRANTFMNMSQQSISLRHQIQRRALEQGFTNNSSQDKSQKRLSSKLSSPGVFSVGTPPLSSSWNLLNASSNSNKEEKRKSLNNSLYTSLLQSSVMNNSNSNNTNLQSKSTLSNLTPQPFDWVLFFIERYELDVNEIEFLNPLYQDMEDGEELTEIQIIEKKKATLVEEDLVTISTMVSNSTSVLKDGQHEKKNSIGTGPEEDEYAWLLKRSEYDIEEFVNSIQRHLCVKSESKKHSSISSGTTPTINKNGNSTTTTTTTNTTPKTTITTTSVNSSKGTIPTLTTSKMVTTSAQNSVGVSPVSSPQSPPQISSTTSPTTTLTTSVQSTSSEPIPVSGYQSSLISKLQSMSNLTGTSPVATTMTPNSPPTSVASSTPPTSNVKVIGSKQANVAAQQQKEEDDDSDISISISSSSDGEDEDDDDLMLSSDDDE